MNARSSALSRPRPSRRRPDSGDAFLPEFSHWRGARHDDDAEAFAEELIASATSGEYVGEDARNETSEEELGGPFIIHTPATPEADHVRGPR